ncbi:MAG TPA: hypothetical protein VJV79_36195 [Polyangiaceae bacterium]|nr:hypothetical protein [Polyangiaceae bacterium]
MAYPPSDWLLDPTFPAPPALPRLDRETSALPTLYGPRPQYPSGTWRVGTHAEADALLEDEEVDTDSQRFAKSDSEAPTVRPGALLQLKKKR